MNSRNTFRDPEGWLFRPLPLVVLAGLLLASLPSCASRQAAEAPKPFTSDGCSASPDGPSEDPDRWTDFCFRHDYRYWRGGKLSERLAADRELAESMKEAGDPFMAGVYFVGVRLGGSPWWPTPWRWGYGWDYPYGYRSLTEEEEAALDRMQDAPPDSR